MGLAAPCGGSAEEGVPVMNSCSECRFYDHGKCRRHPPVRLPRRFAKEATPSSRVRDEELTWGWPEVGEEDWCGEYELKTISDYTPEGLRIAMKEAREKRRESPRS